MITTLLPPVEIQPAALVTLKVYDPGFILLTVVELVFPVVITPPGFRVIVQFPAGKPLSTTEPVDTVQVGCVILPAMGADGFSGCAFIEMLIGEDVQPAVFLAVKL